MKISIIMPVYNTEKYLDESINSVISQSLSEWELVIVNDGSTDNSAAICDSFAQKYPSQIKVIHKKNEGQFLSRKIGIENATGEYIGFLDSDDILDQNYISELIAELKTKEYPDVVCFGFCRFNDNGITKQYNLPEKNCLYNDCDKRKELYLQIIDGKLTGSLCSKLLSREVLLQNFNLADSVCKSRYGEDAYQSFSAIGVAQSICFFDKCLYYYRENSAGASEGFERKDYGYFSTKYVCELLLDFLPQWEMNDELTKKRLYARNFNETVNYMLKYYRAAKTMKRRHEIVSYDWENYLIAEVLCGIENNEFVRQAYLKVWKAFEKNAHLEIFIREKLKKIIGW